jgi:carbamate kinase
MIGYLLEQGLHNRLPGAVVATLLTQVVVDPGDPGFAHPTKPVGPVYTEDRARALAVERGWTVARDDGGWRRVVPSPQPLRIVEAAAIALLADAGAIVVCVGGGGIPVVVDDGALRGVEAVVDKDLAAALLAEQSGAGWLLLLTDVAGVERGHGTPEACVLDRLTPAEMRALDLPPGSMGPKAEAACRFVERTGGVAVIAALDRAAEALEGRAGTRVTADDR